MNNKEPTKINQLQYQEAWSRGINQSYSFYLTLGFFITMIGGYYAIPELKQSLFSKAIGVIFLLLLICQAKTIRLQSDNQELLNKIKEGCNPEKFPSTGLRGIADACHCLILTGMTAFFLLKPLCLTSNPYCVPILAFAIFLAVYYVLGRGSFLIVLLPEVKDFFSSLLSQLIVYFIIFVLTVGYLTYVFLESQNYWLAVCTMIIVFLLTLALILGTFLIYKHKTMNWSRSWGWWLNENDHKEYLKRKWNKT